ncbi:MAG: hypothetical protein Nkreftii_001281 [Candidatus Nitrospira kreftii]|uniref:Uncharacterized protein n=1 Tax=Candidatus Nitrospira kreftii TaxID=2652173 RepID=A0A7S8FCV9_9BACT|nr:MAG: hypothetical protein Nkreftii_001281 [Candidatus Nitrospira kreftii]
MIQHPEIVQAFERAWIRRTPHSYARNVEIVVALFHEARVLGAWPPKDLLDGIDTDVRLALALTVHTPA